MRVKLKRNLFLGGVRFRGPGVVDMPDWAAGHLPSDAEVLIPPDPKAEKLAPPPIKRRFAGPPEGPPPGVPMTMSQHPDRAADDAARRGPSKG